MDPARHKVRWDGKDVSLTVTEFLILEALAQRPGRGQNPQPAARRRLSATTSMSTTARSTATSSASAASSGPSIPQFDAIETLYGVGYRFDEQ